MVVITREEADVIRKEAPNSHIAIANRGKGSRKRYYAEESRDVKAILRRMRPELQRKSRK